MNKDNKNLIKKSLLALGLATAIIETVSCGTNAETNTEIVEEEPIQPKLDEIPEEYSRVNNYYKYVIKNDEPVKVYNSKNTFLLYDKETYNVHEYLYSNTPYLANTLYTTELYDLSTEEMLAYGDGFDTSINADYYRNLIQSTYQVGMTELGDYIEGYKTKDYYTLEEIKELEPTVLENLKKINSIKTR